jgi:phosphoglycolate phosphatase-like HAD superfamily hydrolase
MTFMMEAGVAADESRFGIISVTMVKLVLFDIDGTLVHTGGAGIKAFAKTFATAFNQPNGTERIKFSGRTDISLVREFMGLHNIPATAENFARFFGMYAFWLDYLLSHGKAEACEGVLEFIQDLRTLPKPPRLGLLTGNVRLGAEIKLRHSNLWDLFETGGFADDHEDRNQIAAAAHKRARQLFGGNLDGGEIVVIGDTPHDIRCGRAIGAKVLAVATGGATLEELKRHEPDWAVENLLSLTAKEVCGF